MYGITTQRQRDLDTIMATGRRGRLGAAAPPGAMPPGSPMPGAAPPPSNAIAPEILDALGLGPNASIEDVVASITALQSGAPGSKGTPPSPTSAPRPATEQVALTRTIAGLSQAEVAKCRAKGVSLSSYAASKHAITSKSARGAASAPTRVVVPSRRQ